MEAVGLGVGVIGLAGLFTACLDAIDRVKAFKSYSFDSEASRVQFDGHKMRLEEWGRKVGLKYGQPGNGNHGRLKDPETRKLVEDTLEIVHQIISDGGNQLSLSRRKTGDLSQVSGPTSTRQKLAWALGGKWSRANQVALLGGLLDQLHNLVPPAQVNETKSYDSMLDKCTWVTDLRQALADIQAEKRRAVHAWILGDTSSSDGQERFKDACKKKITGTCDWILENSTFKQWSSVAESSPGLLWIHGGPGFGKTILSSRMVEYLLEDLPNGSMRVVAHSFHSGEHASRGDPYAIMRCWLSQLASHPSVYTLISQAYGEDEGQKASRDALVEILRKASQEIPRLFLVVDGLDECSTMADDVASIPRFLEDLLSLLNGSLRILVVSRNEVAIRQVLRHSKPVDRVTEYEITKQNVRADTAAFSLAIVERMLPKKDSKLKQILAQSMSERCDGQFLWLKLQGPSLKEWQNPRQLQRALDKVPRGLDKIYERTWAALLKSDAFDRAVTILRWATFASRPLTLNEITVAALIDEGSDLFSTEDLPDEISQNYVQNEILDICGSFLEIRQNPDEPALQKYTVHLQHFTVKEFLLVNLPFDTWRLNDRLRVSNEQKQHSILLRHCIWYIRACHSSRGQEMGQHFKDYAYNHWPSHASATSLHQDTETMYIIMDFVYGSHSQWQAYTAWFCRKYFHSDPPGEPRPGFYLLFLNLDEVLLHRLQQQPSEEVIIDNEMCPFFMACAFGKVAVIQAMLDSGVNVRAMTPGGNTALTITLRKIPAWRTYHEVVKLLLDHNSELNDGFHDPEAGYPLINAVKHGDPTIVRLLLEAGADPNGSGLQSVFLWAPLHWAAMAGHLRIVELLHAFGADMEAKTAPPDSLNEQPRTTPLRIAAAHGHLEVARFLIENGADVNANDVDLGKPPLFAAAYHNWNDMVVLLADKGADLEVLYNGFTAISGAAGTGNFDCVLKLIELGAEYRVPRDGTMGPLCLAAAEGQLDIVQLLIDRGADVNYCDGDGCRPIVYASHYEHWDIVKLLAQEGADPSLNVREELCTPLASAVFDDQLDIVELLIEKGADVNTSAGKETEALLLWAVLNGREAMVGLLLRLRGGDTEMPLLWAAASKGHLGVAKLLHKHSREFLEYTNQRGFSALSTAARQGHADIVEFLLLEAEGDPTIRTWCGLTPLFMAVVNGHLAAAKLLMLKDAFSSKQRSWMGKSLAWWARRSGNLDIVSAVDRYVEQPADDTVPDGTTIEFDAEKGYCDACSMTFVKNEAYFCTGVGLDHTSICEDCYAWGIRCFDKSHVEMEKLTFENRFDG